MASVPEISIINSSPFTPVNRYGPWFPSMAVKVFRANRPRLMATSAPTCKTAFSFDFENNCFTSKAVCTCAPLDFLL